MEYYDTEENANIMLENIMKFAQTFPEFITNSKNFSDKCNDFYKDVSFTQSDFFDVIIDMCFQSTTLPHIFSKEIVIVRRLAAVFLAGLNCHQKHILTRVFMINQRDCARKKCWTENDADDIFNCCMRAHYPCIEIRDNDEPIEIIQAEIDLENLYQSDIMSRDVIYNKVVRFLLGKMTDPINAKISDIFMDFEIFHNSWIILLRRTFNDRDFLVRAFKDIPSAFFLKLCSPALCLYFDTISTDPESALNQLISEFFPSFLSRKRKFDDSEANQEKSNEIVIELLHAFCDQPLTEFQIPLIHEEKGAIVDVFIQRVLNGNIPLMDGLIHFNKSKFVVFIEFIAQRPQ